MLDTEQVQHSMEMELWMMLFLTMTTDIYHILRYNLTVMNWNIQLSVLYNVFLENSERCHVVLTFAPSRYYAHIMALSQRKMKNIKATWLAKKKISSNIT